MDVIFFDRSVLAANTNHQRQAEGCRCDADDNGRQDQHVWQRVGIDVDTLNQDGGGAAFYLREGDIQNEDRGLENVQANQFFYQVAARNNDI